jgi:hypothetical protein
MNVAELRSDIQVTIPSIVECLKHSDESVRLAVIHLLSTLAHRIWSYIIVPSFSTVIVGEMHGDI